MPKQQNLKRKLKIAKTGYFPGQEESYSYCQAKENHCQAGKEDQGSEEKNQEIINRILFVM